MKNRLETKVFQAGFLLCAVRWIAFGAIYKNPPLTSPILCKKYPFSSFFALFPPPRNAHTTDKATHQPSVKGRVPVKQAAISTNKSGAGKRGPMGVLSELWKNKFLYLMMVPTSIWFAIFCYMPLYGIIVAFKKYNYADGIWGSPFVGLENFKFLFNYQGIGRVFWNTIYLNVLFLVITTTLSVLLAVMFVEIRSRKFKRITQSIAILPHFVSWAVVSLFLQAFIGSNGLINQLIISMGGQRFMFYNNADPWPLIFVILRVWQGCGFGTVVYIAAITAFDSSMYEAARVDGASRIRQIIHITLPLLRPTIVILTIMGVGGIFRGDFGMIYAMVRDNAALYRTTDVVDTFVYRALRQMNNLGMSTATSLFQSIIGFILVVATNAFAKRMDPDTALF